MRRSDAPSFINGQKRARFMAPFCNPISKHINEKNIYPSQANSVVADHITVQKCKPILRTIQEILSIISDPYAPDSDEDAENVVSKGECVRKNETVAPAKNSINFTTKLNKSNEKESGSNFNVKVSSQKYTRQNCIKESKFIDTFDVRNTSLESKCTKYYNVMWCKRSMKKHKIWEGEGILIVENRSAILKDMFGKEIDRAAGYKVSEISSIEEGSSFYIGGKECEIQFIISDQQYKSQECFESPENKLNEANSSSGAQTLTSMENNMQPPIKKFKSVQKANMDFCTNPKNDNYSTHENTLTDQKTIMKPKPVLRSAAEILAIISDPYAPDSDEESENVVAKIETNIKDENDTQTKRHLFSSTNCNIRENEYKGCGNVDRIKNNININVPANDYKSKALVTEFKDTFGTKEIFLESKVVMYFHVLWCRRSTKKNKKWESEGILIIENRCAVLKDISGKVIDREAGIKTKRTTSLESGCIFYIGEKECEIQFPISEELYKSGECFESSEDKKNNKSSSYGIQLYKPVASVFLTPMKGTKSLQNETSNPFSYPKAESEALILPPPSQYQVQKMKENKIPIVDVLVDSFLSRQLRPHQKEGIIFMYKCISGFHDHVGQGVILADEMGLGKTLQCIALVWTLYKQGPFNGVPLLKKVIIITPSSLVTNWHNEFLKWLGASRLSIYAVDQHNRVKDYIRVPKSVLIISYEMFLRSVEALSGIPFDLVICDEGHRIKNVNIKISNVINCLSTMRRILLTGTPIQNDLVEFYSIIEFVNPGILGTMSSFRKYYEKPIVHSQNPNCDEYEKELGEERSNELASITNEFMLRRTQEVINQYLPPKVETVIFCRPSLLQINLYKHFVQSKEVTRCFSGFGSSDGAEHLMYILILRKLCNHPSLLTSTKNTEHSLMDIRLALPDDYRPSIEDSGKLKVLESILASIYSGGRNRKIVIVSGFTQTLDIIESLCKVKNYNFLRLDGSTSSTSRQELVNSFNRSCDIHRVFLLSSKAGGVGFNLIGASYILLYDVDWNPANDLQAMARVWRDGQKHTVYVYRLLTAGTIEEKIYQRQVSKQSLSRTVFINCNTKAQFSHEELKDIFTFHEDVDCLTHDLIECNCLFNEFTENGSSQSSQKKTPNVNMAELLKWKHIQGPIPSNFPDRCIAAASDDITFLFKNEVNFSLSHPKEHSSLKED